MTEQGRRGGGVVVWLYSLDKNWSKSPEGQINTLVHSIVHARALARSLLVFICRYQWLATTTPAVLIVGYYRDICVRVG